MAVVASPGIVLVEETENVRPGSNLVIAGEADLGPNRGVVVSAGPDVDYLKAGTLVYYCDHNHPKIGNAIAVGAGCILAYEELEF